MCVKWVIRNFFFHGGFDGVAALLMLSERANGVSPSGKCLTIFSNFGGWKLGFCTLGRFLRARGRAQSSILRSDWDLEEKATATTKKKVGCFFISSSFPHLLLSKSPLDMKMKGRPARLDHFFFWPT